VPHRQPAGGPPGRAMASGWGAGGGGARHPPRLHLHRRRSQHRLAARQRRRARRQGFRADGRGACLARNESQRRSARERRWSRSCTPSFASSPRASLRRARSRRFARADEAKRKSPQRRVQRWVRRLAVGCGTANCSKLPLVLNLKSISAVTISAALAVPSPAAPNGWRSGRGELIVFAPGYRFVDEPAGAPASEPGMLAPLQGTGIAVATLTYRKRGLAVKQGVQDVEELFDFIANDPLGCGYGRAARTWLVGERRDERARERADRALRPLHVRAGRGAGRVLRDPVASLAVGNADRNY